MLSASKKRSHRDSGASGDKRQRLSGDVSESGETKSSGALHGNSAGETKEDRAADRLRQVNAKIAESKSKKNGKSKKKFKMSSKQFREYCGKHRARWREDVVAIHYNQANKL